MDAPGGVILDACAMVDVFALALGVVLVKIGGTVTVSPGPGLGCFFAGAALSTVVSWILRRRAG